MDLKQIGNDIVLDVGGLVVYQRFLAEHLSSPNDSGTVAAIKMGCYLAVLEEFKRWAARQDIHLNIF